MGETFTLPWPVLGELATREQALIAFLAASPAGLTIVDSQLHFVWINQTLAEINGLPIEAHLGKTVREVIPWLASTVEPLFHRVLTTGQPVINVEISSEAPGQPGFVRHWIESYFPIRDTAGCTVAVGAVVMEITAHVHVEEELRKQKEILQKIFDHAPIMISFIGQDGRIKLVNREWEHTLGWTQDEIQKGVDALAGCYPDPRYREEVLKFIAAADGTWADFRTRTRDGRRIDTAWARVRLSDGTSVGIGKDVTERKQAELALREERNRAQKYLDIAGVMLLALNSKQEVVLMNSKGCEILGYEKDEIMGRRWCDNFIPARDRDWINRAFAQLFAGQIEPVEYFENPVLRKTGDERLIAWHNTALRDEAGRIVGILSSGEDITERRRAEDELRQAEEQYRNIFDEALEGIYRSTPDGRFVAANHAFAKMLGYDSPPDLMSSVTDSAQQVWADPDERLRVVRLLETSEFIRGYECQLVRKDGVQIWVSASSRRVRGPDGKTQYYEGFVEDITERKRAEENRSLLAAIVESSEDFIIAKDLNGVILSWNRAAERMYGWPAEEALGKRVDFLFPRERAGELHEILEKIRRGERIEPYETERVRKDGTRIAVSLSVAPIRNSSGAVVGASAIARDITERKRAKEDLQRSFEQLRALAARLQSAREEERKRVAREIHDELGQALTAIKMDLTSVLEALPPDQQLEAQRGNAAVKLLDQTVQSVRRIATELRPSLLDDLGLMAALEWAAQDFQARTGTKCRVSLPAVDIVLDPERATALFRIFQETLTNVARHAAATEVNARLAKEDGVLLLEVRDNGKGANQEQLTAPTSLGILGMRERALLLGGELTIAGAPGEGTRVSARIPVGENQK